MSSDQYWDGYAEALKDIEQLVEAEEPHLLNEIIRLTEYLRQDRLGVSEEDIAYG